MDPIHITTHTIWQYAVHNAYLVEEILKQVLVYGKTPAQVRAMTFEASRTIGFVNNIIVKSPDADLIEAIATYFYDLKKSTDESEN